MNTLDTKAFATRTYKWGRISLDAAGRITGAAWYKTKKAAEGYRAEQVPETFAVAKLVYDGGWL